MGHFDESGLEAAAGRLTTDGIDVVRLTYCDLIGSERGRDLLVQHFPRTVGDGVAFCRSVYGTTPMGDVVDIEGGLSEGLPDIVAFPDLETFRTVPWEPGVATVIADLFNPDGSPSELSVSSMLTRRELGDDGTPMLPPVPEESGGPGPDYDNPAGRLAGDGEPVEASTQGGADA